MPESSPGNKRALLISIADYPYPHWKLDGCSNDLALMYAALNLQFGFPRGNIALLRDEEATRQGILDALEALVASTEQDDIVVIHYAGHGSQMTCREGDEPDGLDETLVPYDSGRGEDENRDITDDELHLFLVRLGEKTSYTTLIFDCCHSGTITRDSFGGKVRSVESDLRSVEELPPSPIEPEVATRSTRNPGPSGWLTLSEKYVLIAGCAEHEKSAEKRVESDTYGALTWYLSQELAKAGPGTTYRDVFEGMTGRVTANCAAQHPQMEGSLDRELFGVHDIEPMRYVGVTARDGSAFTLAAGAAHGMRTGSRWAVLAPGSSTLTEDSLGEIEVEAVSVTTSRARLLSETADGVIEAGSRAVETAHSYGDLRLRVELEVPEAHADAADAMRAEIEASNLLAEPKGGAADVRVYLIDVRPDPPDPDSSPDSPAYPVPQLGTRDTPTWVAVGDQGEIVLPLKSPGREMAFVENLEKLARYRQAIAIENPSSRLCDKIEMEFHRILPDGDRQPARPERAGGQVVFTEGDRFELRIANRHTAPLYINLVDFDPAGAIGILYPPQGANDALAPGEVLKVPHTEGGDPLIPIMRARLPANFPFARREGDEMPIEGTETFKLFVTTEPADFSFLRSEGYRSAATETESLRHDLSPLEFLMRSATGHVTRSDALVMRDSAGPDWVTIDRPYITRKDSREALDSGGEAVELGSVTIHTPGLTGQATVHPWQSERGAAAQLLGESLSGALSGTGVDTRQTIELAGVRRAAGVATRSADGGDGELSVDLRDPGTDYGQMVLATNEQGWLSWHFAAGESGGAGSKSARRGADDVPATRSADDATGMRGAHDARRGYAPATRRFTLSSAVEEGPEQPARRGLVGAVGKKFIQELVFPLLDPVIGEVGKRFVAAFERKRRPYRFRTFTPENFLSEIADPLDGDAWRSLGSGRTLLLLHGAFARSHTGFGALPREFVETLHRQYEGRVIAFDHHTLTDDPRTNVEELIRQLPAELELDLDIVCHARGGLVARVLAERQGELGDGARRIRIRKVVFAGAPNAGTELADTTHLSALLDRYTNLLNVFDFIPIDTGVVEVLETIITVAKQLAVGVVEGLDGLQSMVPAGEFQTWLDRGRGMADTRYFALASDYQPSDPTLRKLLISNTARRIFGPGGNDLIVPTSSVYDRRRSVSAGSPPAGVEDRRQGDGAGAAQSLFPIHERHVVQGGVLAHFNYFADREMTDKIVNWLRV